MYQLEDIEEKEQVTDEPSWKVNDLAELLLEEQENECYYLPSDSWNGLFNIQDAYNRIIKQGALNKKIIYGVSCTLWIDRDYKITLLIKNELGLENAFCLYKKNKKNGYISLEELSKYRDGLLIELPLEEGLTTPVPENRTIIDFFSIIGLGKNETIEQIKDAFKDFKVVSWASELEEQFDQIIISEEFYL